MIDYFIGILLSLGVFVLPFFILFFYCRNLEKLEDEEFEEKYGAVYDGLDKTKRASIAY
jgi:hypothetical protein